MKLKLKYGDEQSIDIYDSEYEDCLRVQRVLNAAGFNIDVNEAQIIWQGFSDSCHAGWVILPEVDEDILRAVCTINGENAEYDIEYEEDDTNGS